MTHRLTRFSSPNHDILFALSKSMRDRVVANRNYDATSVDTDWWVYGRVFRFYTASYCVSHYEIFKLELRDVSPCVSTLLDRVMLISNTNQSHDVCSDLNVKRYIIVYDYIIFSSWKKIGNTQYSQHFLAWRLIIIIIVIYNIWNL